MELALSVIGQTASRGEQRNSLDFRAGSERRDGNSEDWLSHNQFERFRTTEVARNSSPSSDSYALPTARLSTSREIFAPLTTNAT